MEHWAGAPVRKIKVEELDIKTEFQNEETVYNESDSQFNAVIFGTDTYNSETYDENGYINHDNVNSDFQITINNQYENLDSSNVSTVQKSIKIREKPDEISIKNEHRFYTEEDNIFKYNFDHEIVVKNEIVFDGHFAMNSKVNHEEENEIDSEDIAKEFGLICKKRKTKKENYNNANISENDNKINAETTNKEEIIIENENIKDINYKKEEYIKKRKEIISKSKENIEMPLLIPISKKKTYICNDCGYNFNHLGNLKRHISRRHIPTLNINKTQEFSCSNCAFKCSNKSTLEKHKNKHRNKPFLCNYCDYTTRLRYALNRHLKTHTGEKQFTCEICDRKCTTKRGLEYHLMIHSGKKPFSCDKCDFKAVNKHDIKRHSRIHTGEKPFSCEVCGYSCIRKYHLSSHMRRHLRE